VYNSGDHTKSREVKLPEFKISANSILRFDMRHQGSGCYTYVGTINDDDNIFWSYPIKGSDGEVREITVFFFEHGIVFYADNEKWMEEMDYTRRREDNEILVLQMYNSNLETCKGVEFMNLVLIDTMPLMDHVVDENSTEKPWCDDWNSKKDKWGHPKDFAKEIDNLPYYNNGEDDYKKPTPTPKIDVVKPRTDVKVDNVKEESKETTKTETPVFVTKPADSVKKPSQEDTKS